jgi:hypothetical protein
MMLLSSAYETPNHFYVVAYDDGHGNIELTNHTFTKLSFALGFVENHIEDYKNLHVLRACLQHVIEEI